LGVHLWSVLWLSLRLNCCAYNRADADVVVKAEGPQIEEIHRGHQRQHLQDNQDCAQTLNTGKSTLGLTSFDLMMRYGYLISTSH
jgi:hypothetical protein